MNAGKIVTVSKTDIYFNGWTGCGYIIVDPNTGAGAYMISGGMNGAWLYLLAIASFAFLFLSVFSLLGGPLGLVIAGIFTGWMMERFVSSIQATLKLEKEGRLTRDGADYYLNVALTTR